MSVDIFQVVTFLQEYTILGIMILENNFSMYPKLFSQVNNRNEEVNHTLGSKIFTKLYQAINSQERKSFHVTTRNNYLRKSLRL